MKCVDDFRLRFGKQELVPIIIGGMGVDISTAELALEAARLGGIGHISDAMVPTVSDRRFKTHFVKEKLKLYKYNVANADKSDVQFDLGRLAEATQNHVGRTMEAKRGEGLIFVNCMEKLTMNAPRETLRVRLTAALDAGIDGITLSAGLHLGSFALIEDHPRFRDAKLGIIVSSLRALQLFLRKNAKLNRLPDYVIVEGPLAGGHLGFGMDWANYDLRTIMAEIQQYLKTEKLDIPLIRRRRHFHRQRRRVLPRERRRGGAGGDALYRGAGMRPAGQGASRNTSRRARTTSRSTPSRPPATRCACSRAARRSAPASGPTARPTATCSTARATAPTSTAYNREVAAHPEAKKISVKDKTCLCTHMRNFDCWTCGHYTYRLKDTTRRLPDGSYQLLSAEHVFRDYQFSTDQKIALPA